MGAQAIPLQRRKVMVILGRPDDGARVTDQDHVGLPIWGQLERRAGGRPVMIEMLFGVVKLGTTHSAMALNPSFINRAILGMIPSRRQLSK